VLFIRLRSIGDTVLLTPCLSALKSWRPDIKLSVLMEPLSAPLLEGHPLVDEVITCQPGVWPRAKLVRRLRRSRFDVAFNMHGGTTATILAALSGSGRTIGYRGYRSSWLLTDRAPDPDAILGRAAVHSVEQQLALLNWSGVPWPEGRPRLNLAVPEAAIARVQERLQALRAGAGLRQTGIAVIAPGAALQSKTWPAARFAAIADHLSERWKLWPVIIAGPGQDAIADEVAAMSRTNPRVMTGLALPELTALLGLAVLFVGNDSGPMHIAAALGRAVVAVFGSSDQSVWHPWTDAPYRVVANSGGSIKSIPEREVIAAIDAVLEAALTARC